MKKKYHLRRREKAITDKGELLDILAKEKLVTFAMCKNNEPYLVTVNHGFDRKKKCVYFHCATTGKKIDFLKANRVVWGQVLDDRGYVDGDCSHQYRTVQFRGLARFLKSKKAKLHALKIMINQLEKNPGPIRRSLKKANLEKVAIGCIRIQNLTGKKELPGKP